MLTKTMPPAVSASTGMDALTHAVETYVSVGSEPISDALAIKAIAMIATNLREVVKNGDNLEARAEMLLASHLAGIAFINGKLGLVHAVAQSLGGRHGIPHGVANAVMLPPVMRYNLSAKPYKFAEIARAMGADVTGLTSESAAEMSVEAVKKLSEDIGIPKSLKEWGIDESMLDPLADAALDDRGTIPFNPQEPTKTDIIEIYKKVL
jgi:alcohol dehydrogenase class IV